MSVRSLLFHCRNLIVWLCGIALFPVAGFGGTIFSQIQEQVVLSGSPPSSISYDSGQIQSILLSHETELPSSGAALVRAAGSISGNDIQAATQAQTGQAFMDAFWQDGITVGGLAPGTPVSLLITNSLTSHAQIQGNGSAIVVSDLRLFLSNPVDLILSNTNSDTHNGTQTVSRLVTLLSGDPNPFVFDEHLALRAISDAFLAEADAPNDIFIDVLTPGATVTSQSGVNYSSTTATPEPGTAGFALAGIVGLLVGCARKQIPARNSRTN